MLFPAFVFGSQPLPNGQFQFCGPRADSQPSCTLEANLIVGIEVGDHSKGWRCFATICHPRVMIAHCCWLLAVIPTLGLTRFSQVSKLLRQPTDQQKQKTKDHGHYFAADFVVNPYTKIKNEPQTAHNAQPSPWSLGGRMTRNTRKVATSETWEA